MTGGLLEPASLSHNIVTNLLRDELGYQHLVVTDDLEMGAIAKHCEIEAAAVRAFLAGNDMMLICARPDIIRRGYQSLLGVARDGKLPKDRMRGFAQTHRRHEVDRQRAACLSMLKDSKSLSEETTALNAKLNYKYGGTIG